MLNQAWCWWCVGRYTAHLAKLPHFPSFLNLLLVRESCFDGPLNRLKLLSVPRKVLKSGVLVKNFFFQEAFPVVNADRVKRKLPSLLVDGSTTKRKVGIA